jgi:signal transduction histidine kinase
VPPPPITATDLAAAVLAILAGLYAWLWWRDRERGMHWMALSFALAALWYAGYPPVPPTGPYVDPERKLWSVTVVSATVTMLVGLVQYLGPVTPRRRWAMGLLIAPGLGVLALHLVGVPVLRTVANSSALLGYIGGAVLAFHSTRREPGAGHALIGLSLLALPLLLLGVLLTGADMRLLRELGAVPLLVFGLTLLTVSLQRRRRALEAEVARRREAEAELQRLNATLEQRVTQRTADLRSMVAGLESFNRSISHDLRGPLGGIAGLARVAHEALLRHNDDNPARRALPAIAEQAEHSTRLVGALLELARVGDVALQRRPVPLTPLVQDVIGQLALAAPQRPLPHIRLGSLPEVQADPELLRPVLSNLIGNAVKFSRNQTEARVEIEADATPSEHIVCVRDNGVGFDAGAAEAIFQPFQRLHGGRYEGSGVGLSIVRRAVERHGGRVWAEATPGEGARFYFSLPRAA